MRNSPPSEIDYRQKYLSSKLEYKNVILTHLMERARHDPVTFIELIMRDSRTNKPLRLKPFQQEWQHVLSNNRKVAIKAPVNHGKSTGIIGRVLWEIVRNPRIRIKYLCQSEQRAVDRCMYIKSIIRNNDLLREIAPHLAIEGEAEQTKRRFTVIRDTAANDPTFEALGVTSSGEGCRCDLLVLDDVVEYRNTKMMPGMCQTIKHMYYNTWHTRVEPDGGREWSIFTPCTDDDLNAELSRDPSWTTVSYPIPDDLAPIWEERWPREKLLAEQRAMPPAEFARAYFLRPFSEEESPIRPEHFDYWLALPEKISGRILAVDPAVSEGRYADYTAVILLAVREGSNSGPGEMYVENVWREKIQHPEQVERIKYLYNFYRPAMVIIESVAYQRALAQDLLRAGVPAIESSSPKGVRGRSARVARLSLPLKEGMVKLRGDRGSNSPLAEVHHTQRELYAELTLFPAGKNDDLLDALCYAVEAAQQAYSLIHRNTTDPAKLPPWVYSRERRRNFTRYTYPAVTWEDLVSDRAQPRVNRIPLLDRTL